jgi:predicted transcriptional regulator
MKHPTDHRLSRRERQIMDVLYRSGEASAVEVTEALPDPPSNSAVRALLRILERKGHIRHRSDNGRHIYAPTRPRREEARWALRRVLDTFYGGSPEKVVAALLNESDTKLSEEDLDRLETLIRKARKEGK